MKSFTPSAAVMAALLLTAGAAQAAKAPAKPAGDPVKGKATFNQQCVFCHATAAGVEGAAPSLHNVFGRKAASEPGFKYSAALKASGKTWTVAGLDAFLANPQKAVPGTAMPVALADATNRQNVIAYLASLKATH